MWYTIVGAIGGAMIGFGTFALLAINGENREIRRLRELFASDEPWSLLSCLDTLAKAADILLYDENFDSTGYECIGHAIDAANRHIGKIEQALKGK